MTTPASIERHPIHPMLVVFPLGLLFIGVVFDIVTLLTGSQLARTIAFYDIAAGIMGALLAAIPGFVDYLSLRGPARRLGTWHMVMNLATVVIFSASFVLRTQWGTQWVPAGSSLPQALAIIGAVTLGVGGWLGGHLVYVHGVGVEPAERARMEDVSRPRRAA